MRKSWKVNEDRFWNQTCYGDADKYTKTKIKIYADNILQIFMTKKCQKKKHNASLYQ